MISACTWRVYLSIFSLMACNAISLSVFVIRAHKKWFEKWWWKPFIWRPVSSILGATVSKTKVFEVHTREVFVTLRLLELRGKVLLVCSRWHMTEFSALQHKILKIWYFFKNYILKIKWNLTTVPSYLFCAIMPISKLAWVHSFPKSVHKTNKFSTWFYVFVSSTT